MLVLCTYKISISFLACIFKNLNIDYVVENVLI